MHFSFYECRIIMNPKPTEGTTQADESRLCIVKNASVIAITVARFSWWIAYHILCASHPYDTIVHTNPKKYTIAPVSFFFGMFALVPSLSRDVLVFLGFWSLSQHFIFLYCLPASTTSKKYYPIRILTKTPVTIRKRRRTKKPRRQKRAHTVKWRKVARNF